jgi:hypothetical protein
MALARAGRRIKDVPVQLAAQERSEFSSVPCGLLAGSLRDFALGALLSAGIRRRPVEAHVDDIACLLRRAELGEQQSILRVLGCLPTPERFVELAVDACRTNAQPVFAAIACDNGYPAAYFAQSSFNQMVLKAVFIGISARRVLGLARRVNPELIRMVRDYAAERRAAGRSIPDDLTWIESLTGQSECIHDNRGAT